MLLRMTFHLGEISSRVGHPELFKYWVGDGRAKGHPCQWRLAERGKVSGGGAPPWPGLALAAQMSLLRCRAVSNGGHACVNHVAWEKTLVEAGFWSLLGVVVFFYFDIAGACGRGPGRLRPRALPPRVAEGPVPVLAGTWRQLKATPPLKPLVPVVTYLDWSLAAFHLLMYFYLLYLKGESLFLPALLLSFPPASDVELCHGPGQGGAHRGVVRAVEFGREP